MIQDIQKLLNDYYVWLKSKTALRQIGQWIEITTPYLDRHNDYVQIYAKETNGRIILTDDGYTINDLEQTGCNLESPRRQKLLQITLQGFGVKIDGKILKVHASTNDFALKKHNLVQAILAVNDMFYLAVPTVASLFEEDVATWLDVNEIRYTPKVNFTGKTGFDYMFNFVIPKSRRQPERIIRTINKPNRNTAQSVVLSWVDTKDARPSESRAYALLNDSKHSVSPAVEEALQNYEVCPVRWSKRANVMEELAA